MLNKFNLYTVNKKLRIGFNHELESLFGLINIAFAAFEYIPFNRRSSLVTNKSSPTICIFLFRDLVKAIQVFQSSSENGSSMDLIGYLLIKSK